MAQTFKDAKGRQWTFALTIPVARRIKNQSGIDLLDSRAIADIASDPLRWIDLMWFVIEPQAEQHKVTDEEFGLALEGCLDQASEALTSEIADFFQRLGNGKAAEAMRVALRETKAHVVAVGETLSEDAITTLIRAEQGKDLAELRERIAAAKKTLGSG